MKTLVDLSKLGFELKGKWKLTENGELDFSVTENGKSEILYSFILTSKVKSEILYIGKTVKTLSQRLNGYKKPGATQTTNIRLNSVLKELLNDKKNNVEIYVFYQPENFDYKGYKLNLSAGLEDILIKNFNPVHNLHGTLKIIEDVEIRDNEIILDNSKLSECDNLFFGHKVISNSNLNGRINFSSVPADNLPNFGETVIVHLDNLIINPTFTNGNQQGGYNPRINSAAIGNWLQQKNKQVGDLFYFKICNNNQFYFYSNVQ